jgi:hypothetical protein
MIDSPYIQHFLSLGLQKIHQIATAGTYEARHTLLYSRYYPSFTFDFLYRALKRANEADGRNDRFFFGFTLEEKRTPIKAPFFHDPDSGPADIWRWTHRDGTRNRFVYQDHQPPLRGWGYVMWDGSRFDDIGVFESPWEPLEISLGTRLERHREIVRHFAYMRSSWDARSTIFALGGRGWWSRGDTSKVVWPGWKKPPQKPPG